MGYKVMPKVCEGYGPRKGLEGPFAFLERVLYYDPKAGQYWDPRTDFYVEQNEMDQLNRRLVDFLAR
jgi:hypothetical protein